MAIILIIIKYIYIYISKEYEPSLSERIKERKFYFYNKEWVDSIEQYEKNVANMNYKL